MTDSTKRETADDLLTPAGSTSGESAFERALRDGTIPTFQDTEILPYESLPITPIAPAVEKAAWASLIAFIREHKDEGTVITVADPDTFIKGLE